MLLHNWLSHRKSVCIYSMCVCVCVCVFVFVFVFAATSVCNQCRHNGHCAWVCDISNSSTVPQSLSSRSTHLFPCMQIFLFLFGFQNPSEVLKLCPGFLVLSGRSLLSATDAHGVYWRLLRNSIESGRAVTAACVAICMWMIGVKTNMLSWYLVHVTVSFMNGTLNIQLCFALGVFFA